MTDRITNSTTRNTPARSDTGPFVLIPLWLTEAPVSDRAYRLYGILSSYADNATGYAWPSRNTVAERMGCSAKTVDRAAKELVDIGALVMEARYSPEGDRSSNGYHLKRVRPTSVTGGSVTDDPTGEVTDDARGEVTDDAVTRSNSNYTHLELVAPMLVAGSLVTTKKAARKQDEVWDTLLEVCGIETADITKASRGAYNRAAADLRDIGATREMIAVRANVFRRRWPEVSLTPTALARRWPECDPDSQHGKRVPLLPSEQAGLSALVSAWEKR